MGDHYLRTNIIYFDLCPTLRKTWVLMGAPLPNTSTTMTAGHEYVGEVVEVGAGVQGFKPGDLVSGEGHITCGKCRNCLEGHKENCKDAKGVGVNRNGGSWQRRSQNLQEQDMW